MSVSTKVLQKWIKEEKIDKGEVLVRTSGMSGWCRPEELVEFKFVVWNFKRQFQPLSAGRPVGLSAGRPVGLKLRKARKEF